MARVIAVWQGGSGPPVRNDRFIPVLKIIQGKGLLGRKILTPVCKTHDQAEDVRRSLYTSARYYCSCESRNCARQHNNYPTDTNPEGGCPAGGMRLSMSAHIVKDKQGHLRVQLQVNDKKIAIRYMITKYGADPSLWPYQSRAKKLRG